MAYEDELEVAKEAAREAGKLMETYRENGFSVKEKGGKNDLVTDADPACQNAIVEIVHDAFPEDGFLCEEDTELPHGQNDRTWIIDPIDGTTNYVQDHPSYGASIALKYCDTIVVGAIYLPRFDELFSAAAGQGAWLNGHSIRVSRVSNLDSSLLHGRIMSAAVMDDIRPREAAFIQDAVDNGASFRYPGCSVVDLCYVACGRSDGFVHGATNPWDLAAGQILIEEAGGTVRRRPSRVDGMIEAVGSNGSIQNELEKIADRHLRN